MKAITAIFLIILTAFFLLTIPGYLPERTDVVVIGAGTAGMRAAIESRTHTANVILLEKMPYSGGKLQ